MSTLAEQFPRHEFVVLATAAFAGLTANAQEKASTQKAEHDHSSSDPGPENKLLLDLNPNSNTPPPTDYGDVVPIWYSFDLVKKRVEEGGWTHLGLAVHFAAHDRVFALDCTQDQFI